MKANELIEILKELPPDTTVYLRCNEPHHEDILKTLKLLQKRLATIH